MSHLTKTSTGRFCLRLQNRLRAAFARLHGKRKRSRRDHPHLLNIPYIPSEIWGIVIQHACLFDYDPLDTSQELSFLASTSSHSDIYRSSMQVKLTLSLVSREWEQLTRSYRYEFVWIGRAVQAKLLANTLLTEDTRHRGSSGRYIRRLHIETPALERCSPADLRTILEYAPQLFIFSDHRSVQRNLVNRVRDPRCAPEEILKLVAHERIRHLRWTNYDDTPFQILMHPLQNNLATRLEYLELSVCSPYHTATTEQDLTHANNAGVVVVMKVSLPSLRALKVSLDNNTFSALASWEMPVLTNLSVVSSDFSYTGLGFSQFFKAHGSKLRQLELGHSSSVIEEYYVTVPRHVLRMQQNQQLVPPNLAEWCPNLRQFICSADAEWHWQFPDWIAPHILLPAHPRVELIGIRDIDTRLREDPAFFDSADSHTPYFPLYEQISSLVCRDAFPSLRFVRDLSIESHQMRTARPTEPLVQFWSKVVTACRNRGVWLEDYSGVNITLRNLRQASLRFE